MNKTKIEWVKNDDGTQGYTWNPVTGCLHDCEYCYARGIARRFAQKTYFMGRGHNSECNSLHVVDEPYISSNTMWQYPYGFDPTFNSYRLAEPQQLKKPSTIFVCSMADLFGDWVWDEWIYQVIDACAKAPQHRYLFLTKNPIRYRKFENSLFSTNIFVGTTITNIEDCIKTHDTDLLMPKTFLSIEPLQENISQYLEVDSFEWVIIGAESGNRKNKIIPERDWVVCIVRRCTDFGVPVFMKDSLIPIVGEENMIREFPWEVKM